jgi:hypothetical protein
MSYPWPRLAAVAIAIASMQGQIRFGRRAVDEAL